MTTSHSYSFLVTNSANGLPVAGARVMAGGITGITDVNGAVTLPGSAFDASAWSVPVTVSAYTFTTLVLNHNTGDGVVTFPLVRDSNFFGNWTTLVDSVTQNPISGAAVYINSKMAGTSAATGKVWVTGPVGTVSVRIVGSGYDSTFNQTANGPQGFPQTVSVQGLSAPMQILTLVTTPADCTISLNQEDGSNYETVVCTNGKGTTSSKYGIATYQVVAHHDGYQDTTSTIKVIAGTSQYAVLGPVKLENSPSIQADTKQATPAAGGSSTATTTTVISPQTSSLKTTPDAYEWIYPNSSDGKYFTATQAQVYIGNLFVDELNMMQFAFQGNRIPIYGYSSEETDAFGTGKRLVQGQLALNFVSEGYLYVHLQEFRKLQNASQFQSVQKQNAAQLASLATQRKQLVAASSTDAIQKQIAAIDLQIQSLAAVLGPDGLDDANQLILQQSNGAVKNAITLSVPFDIRFEFEGAGRKVQRVLKNCMLTSNEQVFDQSGQTVLDCYGFVARSLN